MVTNRMFNLFIAIAVMLVILFTVREVAATSAVISSAGPVDNTCESLASRLSVHSEYVNGTKTLLPYTEDGPTGVDGGLIYLLSAQRTCAK